jgi:hypothetical protein
MYLATHDAICHVCGYTLVMDGIWQSRCNCYLGKCASRHVTWPYRDTLLFAMCVAMHRINVAFRSSITIAFTMSDSDTNTSTSLKRTNALELGPRKKA